MGINISKSEKYITKFKICRELIIEKGSDHFISLILESCQNFAFYKFDDYQSFLNVLLLNITNTHKIFL